MSGSIILWSFNSGYIFNNRFFSEELTPEINSICEKFKLASVLLKHLPETDKIYTSLGITNTGYYLIRPDMYIELRSATSETEILSRHLDQRLIVDQDIELQPKSEKHQYATGGFV